MDLIEIEFFTWIRKIEFERLKKYYTENKSKKENQKEINLLRKYLELEIVFVKYDDYDFSKLIEKFELENETKKIREKDENKNNEILKVDDTLHFIRDHLSTLTEANFTKVRKHLILYFMLAFAINFNDSIKLWKNDVEIFKLLHTQFSKGDSAKWVIFSNGPKLENIYNFFAEDNELFFTIEKDKLPIFEIAYFLLRDYSTLQLLEESHKTFPCKKYYSWKSYRTDCPMENIIKYFKKHRPFFAEKLKY